MLRQSSRQLKNHYVSHPGPTLRGGISGAFKPKLGEWQVEKYVPLYAEFPKRRPNNWNKLEFSGMGMEEWPKEVGFFNSGDNFEITPKMMVKLFEKNRDEEWWNPGHNEKTVVSLFPLLQDPKPEVKKSALEEMNNVFKFHLQRFGPDHTIYNSVMQGYAFCKDNTRCEELLLEMRQQGLQPNAQSYVNLMLSVHVSGLPRAKAELYFKEAIRTKAMTSVMRLDTEFQMWWDQICRMGSFDAGGEKQDKVGFLTEYSKEDANAKPVPKDMWALWGWDRDERKFQSTTKRVDEEVRSRMDTSSQLRSSIYNRYARQPWAKFKAPLRVDFMGPTRAKAVGGGLGIPPRPRVPQGPYVSEPRQ